MIEWRDNRQRKDNEGFEEDGYTNLEGYTNLS